MTNFYVGQLVTAKKEIKRRDLRCFLRIGEIAKVVSVHQVSPDRPQIIAVELSDSNQMIDIVCGDDCPFEAVTA